MWAAEISTGRLLVTKEVTGSGDWELTDNPGAKIEIDYHSNCLTGDVTITQGILDVDAVFQTNGQLFLSGKDTLIDVASEKTAKFSLPLPGYCP